MSTRRWSLVTLVLSSSKRCRDCLVNKGNANWLLLSGLWLVCIFDRVQCMRCLKEWHITAYRQTLSSIWQRSSTKGRSSRPTMSPTGWGPSGWHRSSGPMSPMLIWGVIGHSWLLPPSISRYVMPLHMNNVIYHVDSIAGSKSSISDFSA